MAKFYIDETNLGSEASEGQARQVISILQEQGWSVEYGSSIDNEGTEDEMIDFDAAFYQVLGQVVS
jgi:hypothetical protein